MISPQPRLYHYPRRSSYLSSAGAPPAETEPLQFLEPALLRLPLFRGGKAETSLWRLVVCADNADSICYVFMLFVCGTLKWAQEGVCVCVFACLYVCVCL